MRQRNRKVRWWRWLGAVCFVINPGLFAEEKTRAAEIEAQREKKSAELRPDEPSRAEAFMNKYVNRSSVQKLTIGAYGLNLKMGGAATGQGFALGPEYLRQDLRDGTVSFLTNYQITTTASTRGEVTFALPRLANERLYLDFSARRHNYNRIDYYGPGPDSEQTGRSNYRYEDMAFDSRFWVNLGRSFFVGPSIGGLLVNVGPGRNGDVVSTEKQFTPEQAPGIDRQTDFVRFGGVAGFDWRDSPLGARSGGVYGGAYDFYNDVGIEEHDFHMLKLRAEQYLPFYNKRRVIALRAQTIFTWAQDGQVVPFYFQPVLGGSEDLRGFRPYRFYGDNSILMNAEYRWEVFAGMDAAVFADAGKVFNERRQFNLQNLESTVGFGFRFNVQNATFLRLDFGFSHEGFMFWLKFNDVKFSSVARIVHP